MSLLSLPDELLLAISKEFDFFPQPFDRFSEHCVVEQNPTLRVLCATNMRLRATFIHELYTTVVFNLKRTALRMHLECVRSFLRIMTARGTSRFIR